MLERMLTWFSRPKTVEKLPELDSRLALGALLVRLAKADDCYLFEEIAHIDKILARRFALDPVAAAQMRATCEKLEAQAPDTAVFTAMVRDGVDYAARLGVYDALWEVSMADGVHNRAEHEIITFAAEALGIDTADAAQVAARYKA